MLPRGVVCSVEAREKFMASIGNPLSFLALLKREKFGATIRDKLSLLSYMMTERTERA